jgi:hypothetical protein
MPYVFIGETKICLPDTVPVAGQRLIVEVVDRVVDEQGENYAETNDTTLRLQRCWGSVEALFSTLQHELNEGVNDHCDLGLTHWQISTLGEGGGPFWLAILLAQDD